jgi:hypothetical protein
MKRLEHTVLIPHEGFALNGYFLIHDWAILVATNVRGKALDIRPVCFE